MATFQDTTDAVLRLHSAERYGDALALIEAALDQHPNHTATLTYWRACFESLMGIADAAVDHLRQGLRHDLWWAEPMLRGDPDLEAARNVRGFEQIVEESARRWREAERQTSATVRVVMPQVVHRATLVVLQGGPARVDEIAEQWRPAARLGCSVVVPGRGQLISSDADLTNWFDPDATDHQITRALEGIEARPSLIAGFSAGGREALRIGLTGSPLEPVGLLLFGPGAPRWQIEPVRAVERGLRVWTFVGSDDWLLEKVQATNRTLRAAGLDVVEIVRGGDGHAMPDDLDDILPAALTFLLPSSER